MNRKTTHDERRRKLQELLKEGAIARAERDFAIVAEWFFHEEETPESSVKMQLEAEKPEDGPVTK